MVVIGHVDAGKSTMMGHLLFRKGIVSKKVIHKYEQVFRFSIVLCCKSGNFGLKYSQLATFSLTICFYFPFMFISCMG